MGRDRALVADSATAAGDPVSASINLDLPYPPSVNRYWRHVLIGKRAAVLLSREAREFKARVGEICALARVQPIEGPVFVRLVAYRPRKIGDLDGVLKGTLDALQGFAFKNDSQIVRILAERRDDKERPRVEVSVLEEIAEQA